MQTIEKTGETVEAAIAAGLEELGVTAAEVMVEVLEEPTHGIFGVGAKPARVRLIMMGAPRRPPAPPPAPAKPAREQPPREAPAKPAREPAAREAPQRENRSAPPRRNSAPRAAAANAHEFDYEEDDLAEPMGEPITDEQADDIARLGKQLLTDLLSKMQLAAQVVLHRAEPTREGEQLHWILNIEGEQVARLIGRRGETLAALQYLVRLMISRRLQVRANVIVDAGSYKAQRSVRLKQLAHRMADQALSQKRTVTLEPMPPHERRIIHLALRSRSDVTTKSIGEGDARKVTISPAK